MTYFIGIDGGGTKSKCVLTDENFNIIYETKSGPTNFLTIGTEAVSRTLFNLIIKCSQKTEIEINSISSVVLGTTGAGRTSDALKLEDGVSSYSKNEGITLPFFKVVSDARIALEGAFNGGAGSILIAGTGSIMFGKDKEGVIHRVGGFGRLIGDEGSGLTLGRRGLNIAAKVFDGREKESLLLHKVKSKFNINNQDELISKVYNDEIQIQHIAPLVIESAEEGDKLCNDILDQETNELLLHIAAMNNKLNEKNMRLVFIGGTITHDNLYSKMLKDKIKLYLPSVSLQDPEYPPEMGAVILAKQFYEKT